MTLSKNALHYPAIDGLRAYAAIGVACMHIMTNGGFNLGPVASHIVGLLGEFVYLFMVICGFSMCCGYYERVVSGKISIGDFYSRRYRKIFPFFALLCLLDLAISPSFESLYEVFANRSYAGCIKKRCVKGSLAKSALAVAEAEFIRRRRYYERIDSNIAPSRFLVEKFIEGGFSSEKVVALQNFLPDSIVQEIDSVEPLCETEPYLLYFGRLSKEKGVDILLEAYAWYVETVDAPMRLKIVGTGPLESGLKALAERLDVSGNVDFAGFKSGLELRSIVKGATFSVMPSVWYENMPYAGIESLASGTPVIGSNIGGIPELVIEGETGFLAGPGNVDDLVEAMERAGKTSEDVRAAMSECCRAYIRERCGQQNYCSAALNIYSRCIESVKPLGIASGVNDAD